MAPTIISGSSVYELALSAYGGSDGTTATIAARALVATGIIGGGNEQYASSVLYLSTSEYVHLHGMEYATFMVWHFYWPLFQIKKKKEKHFYIHYTIILNFEIFCHRCSFCCITEASSVWNNGLLPYI